MGCPLAPFTAPSRSPVPVGLIPDWNPRGGARLSIVAASKAPLLFPVGLVGGLEVGGLEVGGLEVGGLEVGGLEVGGLEVGGLEVGGPEVGGLGVGVGAD